MQTIVSENDFMLRKIFTFVIVFALVAAFDSCGKTDAVETTTAPTDVEIQTTAATEADTTAAETTTEILTTEVQTTEVITTEAATEPVTEAPTTEAPVDDASTWDTAKIVEFYKNAAANTGSSIKSEQTVGLQDISVNNGQLGGIFSFVTPILNSFLSSSTTVTDRITGDFEKLSAADVSSATAYKSDSGTVIAITLNEQTDTGSGGGADGSVAHGIYVVGDLLSVMGQLKDRGLPIDISLENTVISYTNPVLVDENGNIVNGTWSCNVEISLSDYKFAGSTVDSTRVIINNEITAGGGFRG